jgi:hypothetical protein
MYADKNVIVLWRETEYQSVVAHVHHEVILWYTVAKAMIREGKVANNGKGVHV